MSTTDIPTPETLPAHFSFHCHPDSFVHWDLSVDGDVATLCMTVQETKGQLPHYKLKLNSYDLGVDIELAAAYQYLRFERPEVRCVVLTGNSDRVFCAGANIVMLRTSSHAFKVNFCKFTNETRLGIEDASKHSNLRTLAALNGTASGGGYELALAADRIVLVDDRNSAVSLPELPLLGVLPGTGGVTRVVDKRMVRRDLADVFCATAEGVKGKRSVSWGLVDAVAPLSKFDELVASEAQALMEDVQASASAGEGVVLPDPGAVFDEAGIHYEFVDVAIDESARTGEITVKVPDAAGPGTAAEAHAAGAEWWIFKAFRELDDALLHLRLEYLTVGTLTLRAVGDAQVVLDTDRLLDSEADHWFVSEVRNFIRRVLKRLDLMARSTFAVADEGTCFVGTLLELALSADRTYLLNDPDHPVQMGTTAMNGGVYLMPNGLSRLQTRFLGTPERVDELLAETGLMDAERADELGLATVAPDMIDWEDDLRIALEERASFSPDALTGMEANLRFAGPETMETKIFGRLSAWQNWIFQRPNAVGERGALKCYGTPNRPELDWVRT